METDTKKKCANCGRSLCTRRNAAQTEWHADNVRYCSLKCRAQAQNQRYYPPHRESIIARVLRRRKESHNGIETQ